MSRQQQANTSISARSRAAREFACWSRHSSRWHHIQATSSAARSAGNPPETVTSQNYLYCTRELTGPRCYLSAATRAQPRPVAAAERHGHSGPRGDVRAPLPAAMPAGSGRARKARLICSGAAGRLNCLMGVQLGFMGVQLGGKGHLGWFAGAAAAVRGLPGSSGRLSPCLPDDGAPRCGCAVRSWPAA